MLRFEVYSGRDNLWRWRFFAANGKIIADSGESYASEYNAVRAAKRTKELAPIAPISRPGGIALSEAKVVSPNHGADPF